MSLAGANPGLPRVPLPQASIALWLGLAGPVSGHRWCQLLAGASVVPCTAGRWWTPRPHHVTRPWARQLGASHPKSSAPVQSPLSQGPSP